MKLRMNNSFLTAVLIMVLTVTMVEVVPPVKAATVETEVQLSLAPNPVGVDDACLCVVDIDPDLLTGSGYSDIVVIVTSPDASIMTLGPFFSDQYGWASLLYVPTMVGNYSVTVSYPGEILDSTNYTSCEATTSLVVQPEHLLSPSVFAFDPVCPEVDETVTFSVSDSFDPEGTITSYFWDFGDQATGSGETCTHAYASVGAYIVSLTVTATNGTTNSAQKIVEIYPKSSYPPEASFVYSPLNPDVNQPITFDASDSNDVDNNIVSYLWDFGDLNSGSGETFTHAYASKGTYTVTLRIVNDDGIPDIIQKTVTVILDSPLPSKPEPVAPQASFTYSPLSPQVNDTITFDASGCSDSDGSIVSYSWDFGDGTTSTITNPLHSYDQEGTYTVTLTVTDNDGLTDTATKIISDVVIPEFPSWLVLPLFVTATLAVIIYRKKLHVNK